MTSVADPAIGAHASIVARAESSAPSVTFPVTASERELRLDLFRGLALWLIYIDHLPPNLFTWLTIRNYGFSDATEIFIFISGYTAAFVYGRAMIERGFVVATARILKRVWQIYVAHVFLFTIFLAEISYVATSFENPLYSEEMGILDFLKHPDVTIIQALLLKFRPVNMDVLPLYIVLMLFLPLILWLMQRKADLTLALSVAIYVLTWQFDLALPAYPNGVWYFNPFAWQLLFAFGAWCALGGAKRMSHILASPITLWICVAYLLFAFYTTLTWYVPQLNHYMPRIIEQWMYPINKTNLDVLRFAHFLALAALTVRFLPKDWPGLTSIWLRPLILCGQHSLEIFCLGVFLAFAGHFILVEVAGGAGIHFIISLCGIVVMSAAAWVFSWYKKVADKRGVRTKAANGKADLVGGDMRAIGKPILSLMVLGGLLAASPLCAEVSPKSCDVPAYLLTSDSPLSKVEAAVKDGHPLDILVVGSRSSTITGADGDAYPARLQAALRDKLPGVTVNVVVELVPRKTAQEVATTLGKLVDEKKPVLVVWQTGTVDAVRSVDPDDFRAAIDDGVAALQKAGADAVLMNMQYSPRTETLISPSAYIDNMRVVAQQHDVPVFDRFAIMRQWNETGEFDLFSAARGVELAKRVHDCLGRALATFVIDTAHITPGQTGIQR